jgi:cobalt/nickel transport system permease protein
MILNGLAGIVLGWSVFPALLVALFLQAIIFQFGGLTTLGVNTFNMAVPALVCHFAFSGFLRRATERFPLFTGGFLAGASAVLMSAALMALCLHTTGKEFTAVGAVVVLAHVPVMILEGFITGIMVLFIRRVRPEILALDEAVSQ